MREDVELRDGGFCDNLRDPSILRLTIITVSGTLWDQNGKVQLRRDKMARDKACSLSFRRNREVRVCSGAHREGLRR